MQLTCPACGYSESRAHEAWRLEVCPRCHAEGREVYLADSARPRRFRPRAPGSLARIASRFGKPAT